MRAPYVNRSELLTPLGEWLAARMPHLERLDQPGFRVWRIYGLRPFYRCCLFDVTRFLGVTIVRVFGRELIRR